MSKKLSILGAVLYVRYDPYINFEGYKIVSLLRVPKVPTRLYIHQNSTFLEVKKRGPFWVHWHQQMSRKGIASGSKKGNVISYQSYLIISCHTISIISYHFISYRMKLYHIRSYHIIPYHIISHHVVSYHIIIITKLIQNEIQNGVQNVAKMYPKWSLMRGWVGFHGDVSFQMSWWVSGIFESKMVSLYYILGGRKWCFFLSAF